MKFVYLINSQLRHDYNADGDFIQEAWSKEEDAKIRADELNAKNDSFDYYVMGIALDITQEEAMEAMYPDTDGVTQ